MITKEQVREQILATGLPQNITVETLDATIDSFFPLIAREETTLVEAVAAFTGALPRVGGQIKHQVGVGINEFKDNYKLEVNNPLPTPAPKPEDTPPPIPTGGVTLEQVQELLAAQATTYQTQIGAINNENRRKQTFSEAQAQFTALNPKANFQKQQDKAWAIATSGYNNETTSAQLLDAVKLEYSEMVQMSTTDEAFSPVVGGNPPPATAPDFKHLRTQLEDTGLAKKTEETKQ